MKRKVKDINEIPEAFRSLYKKVGNEFVLQLEDDAGGDDDDTTLAAELAEMKTKLNEFRQNNIALNKAKQEQEAVLKQYEGLDPAKAQELKKMAELMDKDEEGKLIKEGKIDEVLKKRVQALSDRHDGELKKVMEQLKTTSEAYSTQRKKVSQMILDDTINKVVSETGVVRQGAMTDIQNRARATFRVNDDDQLETDEEDDKMVKLTPATWAKKLVADAPYLFETSGGGGASGGQRKGGTNGTQRIISDDPLEFGKNLDQIASGKATTQTAARG